MGCVLVLALAPALSLTLIPTGRWMASSFKVVTTCVFKVVRLTRIAWNTWRWFIHAYEEWVASIRETSRWLRCVIASQFGVGGTTLKCLIHWRKVSASQKWMIDFGARMFGRLYFAVHADYYGHRALFILLRWHASLHINEQLVAAMTKACLACRYMFV